MFFPASYALCLGFLNCALILFLRGPTLTLCLVYVSCFGFTGSVFSHAEEYALPDAFDNSSPPQLYHHMVQSPHHTSSGRTSISRHHNDLVVHCLCLLGFMVSLYTHSQLVTYTSVKSSALPVTHLPHFVSVPPEASPVQTVALVSFTYSKTNSLHASVTPWVSVTAHMEWTDSQKLPDNINILHRSGSRFVFMN